MSLIRSVIRLTTVAALRSQTWAEQRVIDSNMTPLVDALINGPAKPYIVVYTDDDTRSECSGLEIYASRRDLLLTLEMGIASATEAIGEGGATLQFPQTDASMELAIDMLETQAFNAMFGEVRSPWRDLLVSMILEVRRVPSIRGGTAEKGTRWAARQTSFVIQPLGDLPPGAIPASDHWVRRFLALASAHEDLNIAKAAELIAKVIETDVMPDWRTAEGWLGLSDRGVRALGIAPLSAKEEAEWVGDISLDDFINRASADQLLHTPWQAVDGI